jgi:hypothetical protein
MRDATKLTGATLIKEETEFQIGDVYLAPNGEFYIEVKRNGATCNTQVNSVKADLNSGKAKLKV